MALFGIFENAKSIFEKDSKKYVFRNKADLEWKKEVKGKLSDKAANTLEVFGDVFKKEIPLTENLFFTDENNNYFQVQRVDTRSDKQTVKDKEEAFIVSEVKFQQVKLTFVEV